MGEVPDGQRPVAVACVDVPGVAVLDPVTAAGGGHAAVVGAGDDPVAGPGEVAVVQDDAVVLDLAGGDAVGAGAGGQAGDVGAGGGGHQGDLPGEHVGLPPVVGGLGHRLAGPAADAVGGWRSSRAAAGSPARSCSVAAASAGSRNRYSRSARRRRAGLAISRSAPPDSTAGSWRSSPSSRTAAPRAAAMLDEGGPAGGCPPSRPRRRAPRRRGAARTREPGTARRPARSRAAGGPAVHSCRNLCRFSAGCRARGRGRRRRRPRWPAG